MRRFNALLALVGAATVPMLAVSCGETSDSPSSNGGSGGRTAGGTNGTAGKGGSGPAGASGAGGIPGSGGAGGTGGDGVTAGSNQGGGGGDAGAAGGAGAPPAGWEDCPTADDYAGRNEEGWPHTLEVTPEATYCADFNESRTLKEELAKKALLRVAPGSYRLPGGSRANLALPLCIKLGEDAPAVAVATGDATYNLQQSGVSVGHSYHFQQSISEPMRSFSGSVQLVIPAGQVPSFSLDGTAPLPFTDEGTFSSWILCDSQDEPCSQFRVFGACMPSGATLHRHAVVLDGGEVTFELFIGQSPASTEPASFARASGTFRGQTFDQRSYWKLIYSPEHHHFARTFAVLFDEPIDGVCGIEVDDLEPYETELEAKAYAVDCELEQLETLALLSHTWTRDPP